MVKSTLFRTGLLSILLGISVLQAKPVSVFFQTILLSENQLPEEVVNGVLKKAYSFFKVSLEELQVAYLKGQVTIVFIKGQTYEVTYSNTSVLIDWDCH